MAVPAAVSVLSGAVTVWPSVGQNHVRSRQYDGIQCRWRGTCATHVTVLWTQRHVNTVRGVTVLSSRSQNCAAAQRHMWHAPLSGAAVSRSPIESCFWRKPRSRR